MNLKRDSDILPTPSLSFTGAWKSVKFGHNFRPQSILRCSSCEMQQHIWSSKGALETVTFFFVTLSLFCFCWLLMLLYWLVQIYLPQNVKRFIKNAETVSHLKVCCMLYSVFSPILWNLLLLTVCDPCWHWFSVHSCILCCSAELIKHYHSTSITVYAMMTAAHKFTFLLAFLC